MLKERLLVAAVGLPLLAALLFVPERWFSAVVTLVIALGTAEMLRVMSPSAEVQGHSAAERVTVGKKRNVKIKELKPFGNYAVKIVFDDGHDTGLFSWGYLETLGREKEKRWAQYLKELEAKGLTSAQVIAASMSPEGALTLVTKKAG